ncbi:tetraspanin-33-like isoform X1 [Pieris brassicae]|uniref:tetraspanin-33-like isoform X1 n=1 Tax=Pieris brassicae TaxID=7116 RepID=UPI001E65EB17|nr:tetraspanin-33-like isoform X1 [Pieris brassicae]
MHARRRGPNFTYVSGCVKYMIFVLNFIFWLLGGLVVSVGLYAFIDKWQATGLIKLDTLYDLILNVSLLIALMGGVVFIVSFAGCIGALRENTCLLKFYSLCLLILFLVEMGGAVCGFVFPRSLHGFIEQSFTERVVHSYREDPDLQNFIDFAQSDFHCCGLTSDGYMDWSKNEYFNCTSPSVEKCGVPYSCCINPTDISSGLVNIMCGYGVQNYPVAEASKRVWTSGCIEIVRLWGERHLYTIASVALGVALSQLFVIYLAKTLEGQIELQKARYRWQT